VTQIRPSRKASESIANTHLSCSSTRSHFCSVS